MCMYNNFTEIGLKTKFVTCNSQIKLKRSIKSKIFYFKKAKFNYYLLLYLVLHFFFFCTLLRFSVFSKRFNNNWKSTPLNSICIRQNYLKMYLLNNLLLESLILISII